MKRRDLAISKALSILLRGDYTERKKSYAKPGDSEGRCPAESADVFPNEAKQKGYRGWIPCYDPQSPWPDRDDHRVSSLRPHTGEAIPHGNVGSVSWNWFAAAWSASLTLLLCCSFFSRDHQGIRLLARFLFGARGIPDRLLGSCGYSAGDIRCQLGRVRRALYGGSHSAEDWELVFRDDLRGNFLSCLSEPGIGVAKASRVRS
jgi:hypothetical protein